MKVFGKLLHSVLAPVFGVAAMGVLLTGCGDATDPTAVGLDELKFSYGLNIMDMGNGTVRLTWGGANNEDDFAGYNVYGAKDTAGTFSAKEGSTIKLLDDKGEPVQEAKDTLKAMSYNGKDWETSTSGANSDGDFEAFPYYTAGTPPDVVAPSCMPEKTEGENVACKANGAEGGASHIFNGTTTLDLAGLKVGSTYCFTTLATLDAGKKVAQTSSEIRCVTPRAMVNGVATTAETSKAYAFDLEALRVACGDTGAGCGTPDVSGDALAKTSDPVVAFAAATSCNNSTTVAVCIEYFGEAGSKKANFTAGKGTGIQDLGYYADGFSDKTLPYAPALTSMSGLQNKDGYSVSGQSLPLEDKHVYVVANFDSTDTANPPTKFYYHYIYVTGMDNDANAKATFKMDVRVGNKVGAL